MINKMGKRIGLGGSSLIIFFVAALSAITGGQKMDGRVEAIVTRITASLIDIRRDIHCHPELSMQETRTAALVADYFRKLGLDVRTGIGGTGVLGILRGAKLGPVDGLS
jgi:amidohydrolase